MNLSQDEKELLLSVALVERQLAAQRIEEALGVRWSVRELAEPPVGSSSQLSDSVVFPLLPMLAPDVFAKSKENIVSKYKKHKASEGVVEVGTLSSAEAREFFKSLSRKGD